ncbi:MAG: AraC family transcriptional regulator, partial [Ruminiclostridium sp.]|nr:AraC family transcriptional regulator [Ruminiclostridium sp.]
YIYRKDINYIVSTDGSLDLENRQGNNFEYKNIFDFSWLENGNIAIKPFTWTGLHEIKQGSKNASQVITYMSNIPLNYVDINNNCRLIVNIYEDKINSLISNFNPGIFSNITILNGDGEIISSRDRELFASTGMNESMPVKSYLTQNKGYFTEKYNNKSYFVSYTTSNYNGWKFISMIPYGTMFSSLKIMKNLLVIIGFAVWLTGLVVSFAIAVKQYIPLNLIKNLTEELAVELATEKDAVSDKNKKGNSFDVIKKSLFFAKTKANILRNEQSENMPIIKNSLLSSLILNENADHVRILEKLASLNIRLNSAENRIVAFLEEKCQDNKEIDIIQVDTFRNIFIESVGRNCAGLNSNKQGAVNVFPVWISSDCGIIIINGGEEMLCRDDLNQVLEKAVQECLKSHGLLVTIGVSEGKVGFTSFNTLYKEAQEAVKLQSMYGSGMIYYYEDLASIDDTVIQQVNAQGKELTKCLNLGDYDRCKNTVDNLLGIMLKRKYMYSEVKQIMLNFFTSVTRYMDEKGTGVKERIGEGRDLRDEFRQVENIYEFKEWMSYLIFKLIESGEKEYANKNNDIVGRMKDYIHNNIYSEVTIEMIAYQLHYNPSYLRKVFKEAAGVSFTDYVFQCKIEKAKELLINTNMKIEDIARKLDYCASFYFIRRFKETCGMTPKEFRVKNCYNE